MLKIVITTTLLVCTSVIFAQEVENKTEKETPKEEVKTTTIVVTKNHDPIYPIPKSDKKVIEGEKKTVSSVSSAE